ncbi:uncharacterized protein ACLA_081210 [Aspergillus clavatus NRRL 1]|uniref:Uncharacterized protein n=1 Tax=Aspergillus clavatus (strain ATCC 1007 / CBS 513.65 / DSM 816 / NCTC 3887 / NRRL 1 / QM 1276 / 107) TaxID=344612 RepID=A1CSZ7_ASPCL|nr:uncharacterized protein ACLA_081210 [Aspergillus clavatus NRRL 1]EAW06434.1 hypothetical protein ACLA_081210 [Aspergillus clavatus NRRL 1]
MDAKTKIIIKAVVIPLGFLIFILTIFGIFLLKCRRDRKKDEREGLNHSFSPYEAWQTAQPPQNQWPSNQNQNLYQYPISTPQMQRLPPVAIPPPYHRPIDMKGQLQNTFCWQEDKENGMDR